MIIIRGEHIISHTNEASAAELLECNRWVELGHMKIAPGCLSDFQRGLNAISADSADDRYDERVEPCTDANHIESQSVHPDQSARSLMDSIGLGSAEGLLGTQHISAAQKIPPELFPKIIHWITSTMYDSRKDIEACTLISLTCRYWSEPCRKFIWKAVTLKSSEDVYSLAKFIDNPPARSKSVAAYIESLNVLAVGPPAKPWIHLIPIILKSRLSQRSAPHIALSIRQDYDKWDPLPIHTTHDTIPWSFSALGMQANTLSLADTNFRSAKSFLHFARAFRNMDTLICNDVAWEENAPDLRLYEVSFRRKPPLNSISVTPWPEAPSFPDPSWISVMWALIRCRRDGSTEHYLSDEDTRIAMQITARCESPPRLKTRPRAQLRAARKSTGDGYDFFFEVSLNDSYSVIFSTLSDDTSTIDPAMPHGNNTPRRQVHVHHVIVFTERRFGRRGSKLLSDGTMFSLLASQFPHLQKLVLAFNKKPTEGSIQDFMGSHALELANEGRLTVAYTNADFWVKSGSWTEMDPITLQPSGRSCPCYSQKDEASPDNFYGLSMLWK
ncbi:hypothetical protein BDW22DRAFT_1349641 [Trametopsis cervina]|nr:hypothetical protein BDW22DRAFT_1349641 [Trametopsis cervina]